MSKSGEAFMEQDNYQDDERGNFDPEEAALWSAFQSMNYIMSEQSRMKAFNGIRFDDFKLWVDKHK